MNDQLPREVRDVLHDHVHSVGELDLLMLLYTERDRLWDIDKICDALGSPPSSATIQLQAMAAAGLAEHDANRWRFRAANDDSMTATEALSHAYHALRGDLAGHTFALPSQDMRRSPTPCASATTRTADVAAAADALCAMLSTACAGSLLCASRRRRQRQLLWGAARSPAASASTGCSASVHPERRLRHDRPSPDPESIRRRFRGHLNGAFRRGRHGPASPCRLTPQCWISPPGWRALPMECPRATIETGSHLAREADDAATGLTPHC